jgi:hypothetical protein
MTSQGLAQIALMAMEKNVPEGVFYEDDDLIVRKIGGSAVTNSKCRVSLEGKASVPYTDDIGSIPLPGSKF